MTSLPPGFTRDKKPAASGLPEGFTRDRPAREARDKQVVKEYWDKPFNERAPELLSDYGKMGLQGVTLGWSDEMAAGAQSLAGYDYDESLKARQQGLADSKARMNSVIPYSAPTFEATSSIINPLTRAGIFGLGTAGAVSSVGHGERDPYKILAEAGLSSVLGAGRYILRGAQKAAPYVSEPLISYGKSWIKPALVGLLTGQPSAAAGSKIGALAGGVGLRTLAARPPIRTDPGLVAQTAAAAARRGLED